MEFGVISQKILIFIVTAVGISDLIYMRFEVFMAVKI
jgi:hypothetical protein